MNWELVEKEYTMTGYLHLKEKFRYCDHDGGKNQRSWPITTQRTASCRSIEVDSMADKAKIATMWLGGCSGCHISITDIHEALLDVMELADFEFIPCSWM